MTDAKLSICISEEPVDSTDAGTLLEELSRELKGITGSDGRASFDPRDFAEQRSVFLIARNGQGQALGCGAIRPLSQDIAEIKRVYARTKGRGIGGAIVSALERRAAELGYRAVRLETRSVNTNAVAFYERLGYQRIENYGRYVGRADAVCFENHL